jgi:glycosyltransferase involved in cell wall biosynthesis
MENILVSVVVAVYNVESFLRQCLDSIRGQTLREIEVICVDDGSLDASLRILREYEKKDDRIRVMSQENAGPGQARNTGLEVARGKYLSFLDADDFFESDMLEKAVERAERCRADIVLFDAYSYDHVTGTVLEVNWILNKSYIPDREVFSWRDVPDRIFQICSSGAWSMLCRRDFVSEYRLHFQAIYCMEDLPFVFSALIKAKRIAVLDERLLYYRQGNTNSLCQIKSERPDTAYLALREIKRRLEEYGVYDEVRRSIVNRGANSIRWYLETMTTWKSFQFLWLKLKERYLSELDISGHAVDYFYYRENFEWRERIARQEPEEWLFEEWHRSREMKIQYWPFPKAYLPKGGRIALYGAGKVGNAYFVQCLCSKYCKIALWVDRRADTLGYPVESPERLRDAQFDKVLIAIANQEEARRIKSYLMDMGVEEEKIVYNAKS